MKSYFMRTSLSMAVVLMLTGVVHANPDKSGDCAGCHENSRDAFDVIGEEGTGGPNLLKYINVLPQSNVDLTANVFNGGGRYGVALLNESVLPFTQGSSAWPWDTSGPDHFYVPRQSSNDSWTFNLAVGDEAPGFYPFTFTVAGGSEDWAQSEDFYVHVLAAPVPEPGTVVMMLSGLVGLGIFVYGRRRI